MKVEKTKFAGYHLGYDHSLGVKG